MAESVGSDPAIPTTRSLGGLVSQFNLDRGNTPWAAGLSAIPVHDVTDDSRDVRPGSLFVVRRGLRENGLRFVPDALRAGAVAVLVEPADAAEAERHLARATSDAGVAIPLLIATSGAASRLPHLAEWLAGSPAARLRLIGVTGTNGKTTTAGLVQQYLNGIADGLRAEGRGQRGLVRSGLMGTIAVDDGAAVVEANLTTPSAPQISRILARMVNNGCTHAAMEVSSHALDQGRTAALPFAIAIFTNLSGDHLDYHGTMDAYASAKARLFSQVREDGVAIINADDPWAARMTDAMADGAPARIIRCRRALPGGRAIDDADCVVEVLRAGMRGSDLRLHGPWGDFEVFAGLPGLHNAMNILQATAAAWAASDMAGEVADAERLAAVVAAGRAPAGRLEPVPGPGESNAGGAECNVRRPTVVVDYAHTDDALANVLTAMREVLPPESRLGVVFGCGGDRDRTKRPRMASVAGKLADFVTITSDNPRTEDPLAIIDEIVRGMPAEFDRGHLIIEADRRTAIRKAIDACRPDDVLVIAGKGHENYQIIGTVKRPFDDRIVAHEALRDRERKSIGSPHVGIKASADT